MLGFIIQFISYIIILQLSYSFQFINNQIIRQVFWKYTFNFFNSSVLLKRFRDFKSTYFSGFFSNFFAKGKNVNLAYSVIWL